MPTTWYVANAGSNSNNGTSSSTPFQTLAHSTAAMSAGDTLLLNRGDRFYETLTVPQSTVTIDAYGATATFDSDGYCTNAPVIDGGTQITGWSSYTSGVTTNWVQDSFTGTASTDLSAHTPTFGTSWTKQQTNAVLLDGLGGVYSAVSGTTSYFCTTATNYLNADNFVQANITFKTVIASDIGGVIAHAKSGEQTYYSGYLDSAGNVAIQREANGTGGTVAGPTNVQSIVAGTAYTLKLVVQGTVITLYLNGSQVLTYTDTAPLATRPMIDPNPAGVLIHPGSSAETASTGVHISAFSWGPLDTASGTSVNTYQVSLATQCQIVDYLGSYCFAGVGVNSLQNNQWYWYNGILYFRNNSGAPASNSVVASTLNNGILLTTSTKSNVTVQNVAVEHAQFEAYSFTNSPGLTMQNCYAQRTSFATPNGAHSSLVLLEATQTNSVVQNNVFRQFGAAGVGGGATTGPYTIQFNKFYDVYERFGQDTLMGNASDTTTKIFRGNVTIFPGAQVGSYSNSEKGSAVLFGDNWLIERNLSINCPLFGTSHPGNNHTARYNFHYKAGGGYVYTALGLNGGGGALRVADNSATVYTGHQFYGNVLLDCVSAIWVDSAGTANRTNFNYYNNLILNINVEPGVINEAGTAAGTYQAFFNQAMSGSFENNVIYNAQGSGTGGLFFKSETSANAWTTDHNVWTPDATGCFNFKSTGYNTLASYSAGQSRDQHSINSTPTFSNQTYQPPARPGLNEIYTALTAFRNAWRSPARHLGVVVAGVTQMSAPDAGVEATYGTWGVAA